jgi:hypothetical protein
MDIRIGLHRKTAYATHGAEIHLRSGNVRQ